MTQEVIFKPFPPILAAIITSVFTILVSLFIVGILFLILGVNPWHSLGVLLFSGVNSLSAFGYTLFYTTNLIFMGLSVSLGYQVGLFNIGSEGQAVMGGLLMSLVILSLDSFLPPILLVPLAILVAFIGGGIWASIPAFLKIRYSSHEVIVTIMLNFIAYGLLNWILVQFLEDINLGVAQSRLFVAGVSIPQITSILPQVNWVFIMSIVIVVILHLFLFYTRRGFDLRILGSNMRVAKYVGVNLNKNILMSMFVAGGCAGLVAVNMILGFNHRLTTEFVGGLGFIGIAVSIIARNRPIGIIFSALFFGLLYQGGVVLSFDNSHISREMTTLIEGVVLFSVSTFAYFFQKFLDKIWIKYQYVYKRS